MISAIITSDNHLGAYYSRLRPDRLERRRQYLQRGFQHAVDVAVQYRVDLFLHGGDLFDRPDPRNADRLFVAQQIRRLQNEGIAVFAIAGNHDRPRSFGYDGGAMPHQEIEALGAIRLFPGTERLQHAEHRVNGSRIGIWGMTHDVNRRPEECPLADSRHERGGDLDIVLLHHAIEGPGPLFQQEACLSMANLEALQTDLVCLGHLHRRSEQRLSSGALVVNPGATEHIRFDEAGLECGCWIMNWNSGQARTRYLPSEPQPMKTVDLDLSLAAGSQSVEEFMQPLLDQVAAAGDHNQMLRVRLRGRVPRSRLGDLDLAALQTQGAEGNFHCQIEADDLVAFDEVGEFELGTGDSFDARDALQATTRDLLSRYADNPVEAEITRLAGERLDREFARMTGASL